MMRFDSDVFKSSGFLLMGEEPFAATDDGVLKQRIHTFFIGYRAYITLPGVHATQRLDFIDRLNNERREKGEPKLTSSETDAIMNDSVSIVVPIDPETNEPQIGIRLDGDNERAAKAAEMLSQIFPAEIIQLIN